MDKWLGIITRSIVELDVKLQHAVAKVEGVEGLTKKKTTSEEERVAEEEASEELEQNRRQKISTNYVEEVKAATSTIKLQGSKNKGRGRIWTANSQ